VDPQDEDARGKHHSSSSPVQFICSSFAIACESLISLSFFERQFEQILLRISRGADTDPLQSLSLRFLQAYYAQDAASVVERVVAESFLGLILSKLIERDTSRFFLDNGRRNFVLSKPTWEDWMLGWNVFDVRLVVIWFGYVISFCLLVFQAGQPRHFRCRPRGQKEEPEPLGVQAEASGSYDRGGGDEEQLSICLHIR